jgi:hypothetical protein
LHDLSGEVRWLTLPLRKAPQETLIKDMRFAPGALEEFRERLKPFGRFKIPMDIDGSMVDYLERTLKDTAQFLGIRWNAIRSSELGITGLNGQDRILEICKRVGATHYLNAPRRADALSAAGVRRGRGRARIPPRVDRLLHERAGGPKDMNVEQYNRDGFVVLRGALDHALDYMPIAEPIERELRALYSQSKEEYLKRARLLSREFWATRICSELEIFYDAQRLGVRQPAFLTNPAVHVMGVDHEFDGVGAHQDWPALQSGLNTVVVWIPLTDVTLENYPVELVPGSHLRGLLPAMPGAHYSAVDTEGMEFVPAPMRCGDVLLFSVFTVHRTRIPGIGFRLALSHRYEDAEDPWFKQHGNYSAQSRVIEREVKWTPSVEQVKAVFS